MTSPQSFESIIQTMDQSLGIKVRYNIQQVHTPRFSPNEIGLVIAGIPPIQTPETKLVRETSKQLSKLIGILFCPPASKLGKEEILPNLDIYHHRSSYAVDLYCIGYAVSVDKSQQVATVNEQSWRFDPGTFDDSRRKVEALTKWQFSGETDLVLAVARKPDDQIADIDFSTSIVCNLEEMSRDKAFTSVRAFFETIFRFGENLKGEDPVWKLSDKMGKDAGGNFILETVLSLLPDATKNAYKAARHYAIRDISR